jgi:hypothetical protein
MAAELAAAVSQQLRQQHTVLCMHVVLSAAYNLRTQLQAYQVAAAAQQTRVAAHGLGVSRAVAMAIPFDQGINHDQNVQLSRCQPNVWQE